jgi:hypothetical protein
MHEERKCGLWWHNNIPITLVHVILFWFDYVYYDSCELNTQVYKKTPKFTKFVCFSIHYFSCAFLSYLCISFTFPTS